MRRGWKVSEREHGKPAAWTAEAGPLTLLLRRHVVDASDGRQWWILFMLPTPPFDGYVSGYDSMPDMPAFNPKLGRHRVGEAQKAAEKFAADWLKPHAVAYAILANSSED